MSIGWPMVSKFVTRFGAGHKFACFTTANTAAFTKLVCWNFKC